MVPDMKITHNQGGISVPVLRELKVISSSQSRYKPSWKKRGVDKRSEDLHDEYLKKPTRSMVEHSLDRLEEWKQSCWASPELRVLCSAIGGRLVNHAQAGGCHGHQQGEGC